MSAFFSFFFFRCIVYEYVWVYNILKQTERNVTCNFNSYLFFVADFSGVQEMYLCIALLTLTVTSTMLTYIRVHPVSRYTVSFSFSAMKHRFSYSLILRPCFCFLPQFEWNADFFLEQEQQMDRTIIRFLYSSRCAVLPTECTFYVRGSPTPHP